MGHSSQNSSMTLVVQPRTALNYQVLSTLYSIQKLSISKKGWNNYSTSGIQTCACSSWARLCSTASRRRRRPRRCSVALCRCSHRWRRDGSSWRRRRRGCEALTSPQRRASGPRQGRKPEMLSRAIREHPLDIVLTAVGTMVTTPIL